MTRIEFKIAMPSKGSWNGRWSGENRNYTLTREIDDDRAVKLSGRSWSYSWPDGWSARISARVVLDGEDQQPSHGFHGYDWMVDSILTYDKIYASHELPEASSEAAR